MTIEDVSRELGISKSRIQRYLRKGLIRCHSSSIKPYLTEDNRKARLKWCIDMIEEGGLDAPKFKDLFDFVFIDEKWFYLHQKSERYYLLQIVKMNHTARARTRTTSLGSCFCVLLLVQGLEMEYAFLEYCPKRANRMFVTLQTVLKEAMKIKGGNKIKIPHMQKQRLEREDMLPLQIPCAPSLLAETISSLPAN
ncbi:hypothetical protein U9M48_017281 [Paspalum notatum var. saurae]|uniref:HTH merR-type domain-containing protein n=1 Tax=Paspalum notatum var. saurae TaxID=547442 RepID=A0AAQ3T8J5_PASNO